METIYDYDTVNIFSSNLNYINEKAAELNNKLISNNEALKKAWLSIPDDLKNYYFINSKMKNIANEVINIANVLLENGFITRNEVDNIINKKTQTFWFSQHIKWHSMVCSKCDNEIDPSYNYCPHCGIELH